MVKLKKEKINPFEVHINREKQNVLGKKSKTDRGIPGISRGKALKKRKQTLLQEYQLKNKVNVFLDKRIGERNHRMTAEEKSMARFTAERIKNQKKNIYSLNEEEVLTHRGQTLEEIEKFDDPKTDDEDDDDNLAKNFVGEAHFGGGILSKSTERSRKDLIDQLIAESKKRKAEKQKLKEETVDLTTKLDTEWQDLLPLISACKKGDRDLVEAKNDDYDIALRSLKFEARGKPSDKLKSDEDLAKEEKERLESLEKERLIRMEKSADDLDDDFEVEEVEEEEEVEVEEEEENDELSDLKESSESEEEIEEIEKPILPKPEILVKELPFTFQAPENYQEFLKLLENHSPNEQGLIMERIIKCNHWSLSDQNKTKLNLLFLFMLKFIDDFSPEGNCFDVFDRFCPLLYDLTHMCPENAKSCIQDILKTHHEEFEKRKKKYPGINTLVLFKLVSLLFPTSDFRHPVVTPCVVFMSQILLRSRVNDRRDISKGLFICTLFLEYTTLSKKFVPSAINYLRGLLYTATPKHLCQGIKIIPPFKTKDLLLIKKRKKITQTLMTNNDLTTSEIDDEFKTRALYNTLLLLTEFCTNLKELDSVGSIFEPVDKLLRTNEFLNCPKKIRETATILKDRIAGLRDKKLEYIVMGQKRPKALKLYEPQIEPVYDGKHRSNKSKEQNEREKLLHKYKKETKGAIREIRRDRAFLAKVQINQRIRSDEERKRKVRELYGQAAVQQNELKKFQKR